RVIFLDDASFPYDIQAWNYPQLGFLGNALMRGELPLWNPHVYGGMSFVGDVQAALFYPVNLVFLGLGGWIYRAIPYRLIELEHVFHYFLGGCGVYVLTRTFGVSRISSLLAANTYSFGPFLAAQTQHFGL